LDRSSNLKFEIRTNNNVKIISSQIDASNALHLVVQIKQQTSKSYKTYVIIIDLNNAATQYILTLSSDHSEDLTDTLIEALNE